jgi:hypothetical protein
VSVQIIRDPLNSNNDRVFVGDTEIPLSAWRDHQVREKAERYKSARRQEAFDTQRRLGIDSRLTPSLLERMERGG